jgi:hypothetical protein
MIGGFVSPCNKETSMHNLFEWAVLILFVTALTLRYFGV